jgi:hypothetical protein
MRVACESIPMEEIVGIFSDPMEAVQHDDEREGIRCGYVRWPENLIRPRRSVSSGERFVDRARRNGLIGAVARGRSIAEPACKKQQRTENDRDRPPER